MKSLGYIGAFIGGAVAGAVKDFCDKHDIKLTRKQVEELVSEVQEADSVE